MSLGASRWPPQIVIRYAMHWLTNILRRPNATGVADADYQSYCRRMSAERHMYAWTLVHAAGTERSAAEDRASQKYRLRPPGPHATDMRLHEEAWHLAMLDLHGNCYWHRQPGLERAPAAYQQEFNRVWAAGERSGIA
jgi:hypothetical protein